MNWALLAPEALLAALAFLLLGLDLLWRRGRPLALAYLSALAAATVALSLIPFLGRTESLYNRAFVVDGYALFFQALALAIAAVVLLLSAEYVGRFLAYPGEFYGLVLLSTLGVMFLASAAELLTAYISLELLSFSLYALASYAREDPRSNEAGIKYIILGAFASALLLFGLSLLYGFAGTTTYAGLSEALRRGDSLPLGLWIGLGLLLAGLGFKVAAVPFHGWAPDVYEGAPLPVTAYISSASKVGGFAFLVRLSVEALAPVAPTLLVALAGVAALTMTVGNLVALRQRNLKRLLAYSSIGQVGYLLMGVAALTPLAISGLLFHLTAYVVNNLAAFLCLIAAYHHTQREEMGDLAGLAERAPAVALVLAAALFSLAGLPFFVGFVSKFYLFTAAAEQGLLWLASLAIFNSFISLYYYLMVIKEIYVSPVPASQEAPGRWRVSPTLSGLLGVLFLVVLGLGLYPRPLVGAIEAVAGKLFGT